MKLKLTFMGLFIVLALSAMFLEGLFHTDFYSRPSMVFTHGAHGSLAGQEGFLEINELFDFPFKTPKSSIERLEYVEVDGVKEFFLTVEEIMWEYSDGEYVHAWGYNGQVPGPEIRVTEGDDVRIVVENNLPVPTTVHWHGVHVPYTEDGVPGYSQYPIEPGETYTYEFKALPAGSRFYHSHGSNEMSSVTQVDMGLTGAMIIEPREDNSSNTSKVEYDREYVYLLDEWAIAEDGSNGALVGLTSGGGHAHGGHAGATGYNIFSVNGRIDPFVPPMMVSEGERILVRMINVGAQEVHPMHLHGHSFKVVAIDGDPIPPEQQRTHDVITLHPSERIDIEFIANNPGAWLFHCHHLHHAAGGMVVPFIYEGYEQCCQDV